MATSQSRTILIILGVVGSVMLVLMLICGGLGFWFLSYPAVSATASAPYEILSVAQTNPPQVGPEEVIEGGVRFREVKWGNGLGQGPPPGANSRVWIYLPTREAAAGTLPCVMICGAGSTLMQGMNLSTGDQAEHIPYVQAGFAVVAFDLDGGSDAAIDETSAYMAFRDAQAGLVNARNALQFALASVPEVNPQQIFSVGHSSAGTMALLFAEHEPRLAGCVAYAPATDLKKRMPAFLVRILAKQYTGLPEFFVRSSPRTHESRISCPVMLFHAEDDSNVDIADSRAFAARLKAASRDVTLEVVPTGDHYESMVNEGIPKGIEWMKKHLR